MSQQVDRTQALNDTYKDGLAVPELSNIAVASILIMFLALVILRRKREVQ